MTQESAAKELSALLAIQADNLDDDYMVGLYNGMELALAMLEGRDPQYRQLQQPQAAPPSTAHPALAALTRMSGGSHLLGAGY